MKKNTIRIDNREPAILTAELTYLGYQVENALLKAGDFEGKTIIGEIKRNKDFYDSIVDQRIYYQPKKMPRTGKKCYWILAGNPTDERRKLRLVLNAILTLVLDYEMALIPVANDEAAIAYVIHTIMAKKDEKKMRRKRNKNRKIVRHAYKASNVLNIGVKMCEVVPGIGTESAKTISEWYPTIVELTRATMKDLEAIPTIGRKRAQIIYTALRGKY